jgi:prevent-host-death family protein
MDSFRGEEMAAEDLSKVTMHEAKTHLSRLVARVEQGEEITITRAGKPAAKLVPVPAPKKLGPRKLGGWEGKMKLPTEEEMRAIKAEITEAVEKSRIFPGDDEMWKGA